MDHSKPKLISISLLMLAIVGCVIWIVLPRDESGTMSPRGAEGNLDIGTKPAENPLAASIVTQIEGSTARNRPYNDGKYHWSTNPEVAGKVAAFRAELRSLEAKRTQFMWESAPENCITKVFAIKAPESDELGKFSEDLTAHLRSLPPELQPDGRKDLQLLYDQFATFQSPYKVIFFQLPGTQISDGTIEKYRIESGIPIMVIETNREDPSKILPLKNGGILMNSGDSESDAWPYQPRDESRFGYILLNKNGG